MTLRFLFFIMISIGASAQQGRVGINTSDPATTLDVNGLKNSTTGLTLITDASGIQIPQLTLAQLSAKGNALYGSDQNGAIVNIIDVTNFQNLSTGQRIYIKNKGFYYFDAPNNVWQLLSMPYGESLPEWKLAGTYEYVKTDPGQLVAPNGATYTNLDGFTQNITIPAGKQAQIIINYSIPIAAGWGGSTPTQSNGYMGITLLKNGVELPNGSRKSTVVRLSGNGTVSTISLVNVATTTVDFISASSTPQTITYQLQGYKENTNYNVAYGSNSSGNWGFVVYLR